MNSIYHRISVRKYENKPVEGDKIIEILRAAMQAPSANNQQPWEFYVVSDQEKKDQLATVHPWTGMIAEAPICIVTAYRKKEIDLNFAHIDMAICMENMWLMADSLGLGGVYCGIAPNEKLMTAVEKIVEIEKDQRAFGLFPVGYPAESRLQENRFETDRIHYI